MKKPRKLMSVVANYLSKLDIDCIENQTNIIEFAKTNMMFETDWSNPKWDITNAVEQKTKGSDTKKTKNLNYFRLTPNNKEPMLGMFTDVVKALTTLRFNRGGQCTNNLQNFIDAFRYVYEAMDVSDQSITNITPAVLEKAARNASSRLGAGTAYNIHKAIHEIADLLDANKLTKIRLEFRYAGAFRPQNAGGVNYTKLDDQKIIETSSTKMADEKVIEALGMLYQIITKNAHADRVRILLVSLSIFTGRRIGEILTMPSEPVQKNENGTHYISVFTEKKAQGNAALKKELVVLPTESVELVTSIINEILAITKPTKEIAKYIEVNKHADYRILKPYEHKGWMDHKDLEDCLKCKNGWLWASQRKLKRFKHPESDSPKPVAYSLTEIKKAMDFDVDLTPTLISTGIKLRHSETLAILHPLACHSRKQTIFHATACITWQQVSDFLGNNSSRRNSIDSVFDKYLPAKTAQQLGVNTHAFRHSMNTWLDEGGLSDLAQSRWFGRKNDRDTKAYQHTSPAKAALLVQKDLMDGKISGPVAAQILLVPIDQQQAFIRARVQAVHDVGPGLCFHDFTQMPCERSLQCTANCDDFHWRKDDAGRDDDLKRQFAMTSMTLKIAETKAESGRGKSIDWVNHNLKKLETLKLQLLERGLNNYDFESYDFGERE